MAGPSVRVKDRSAVLRPLQGSNLVYQISKPRGLGPANQSVWDKESRTNVRAKIGFLVLYPLSYVAI